VATKPPLLVWVATLACCYHAASEAPCTVSCATDGTCPDGLSCGSDQLCHGGTQDCSELVTGSFGHQLITNDGSGNPLETDLPYGADQLDVNAILVDTNAVPTISFDDDSFSFSRSSADEGYRLSVRAQAETTVPTETQDSVPSLALWSPYFGRISRSGVNKPTLITFNVTGAPVAPNRAYVASTGLRTFTQMSVGSAAQVLDWNTAGALYGANAVLSAADGDVLWDTSYAETVGSAATASYWSIVGAYHGLFTLTNGQPTTVNGAMTPMASDHCVTLTLPRQTEVNRVVASNGFGSGSDVTTSSAWVILSTPFADLSPSAGFTIVYANSGIVVDQDLDITYANPYPEDQVAEMNAVFRRTATVQGATVSLAYVTTQYDVVPTAAPTACASVALNTTIAMPSIPTFGGTMLDTDGATVTIDRSGLVELDFASTSGGSADDWVTVLFEVTVSGTTLAMTELRVYSTLEPSVQIDPTVLVQGHMYIFETYSRVGYPKAASRDYRTIGYPFGTGVSYSSVFTVGN
jgi:hypothetical protein